jgi:CRISPR/Cas system-associated endonuclease Cas1
LKNSLDEVLMQRTRTSFRAQHAMTPIKGTAMQTTFSNARRSVRRHTDKLNRLLSFALALLLGLASLAAHARISATL